MLPESITAVEYPGTDPPTENIIPVEVSAMPTPDGPEDLSYENLVDLTSLVEHPAGTDPPDDTFFPDRLSKQLEFWKSINAPAYIIKQLEEGVDVGLIPDIEKYLPPEGLNRTNTSVNSPELKQALQKLVLELYKCRIVNKRQTRARVNLSVFLIAKPGGKYRFIWNGKPLSPYLDKTAFSYELLSRFLEGVLDGSYLGNWI